MPTYETVEQALDGLRDPQTLAELASVLLLDEYPELVLGARTGDLGRDGRVQRGIWGAEFVVVQYSLDRKWQTKIDRELERYEKDSTLPKRMIYVTHLVATGKAQQVRIKKAAALGVELRIYDRGWFWPRLQHKHRRLAEEMLGLRPSLPGRFVEADERRAELTRRIPGFDAPLVSTPGLVELHSALATRERRVLFLIGPGGSGKTRAALSSIPGNVRSLVLQSSQGFNRDAAGALDAYEAGVLVIDDAHRVEDLSGMRAMLDDAAWKDWTVVMTLRPGFAEGVLDRSGVEGDETTQIAFGALTRPQAAELLGGQPYGITLLELARHLIDVAEGNPLMLHLGAQAAKRGDLSPRGEADLLRGYARRLRRSVEEGLHSDLVTIAAFYGGLSVPDRLSLIRRLHPAAALPDIRSALADVADAGLGLLNSDVFTVTPDAVAPVLVLDGLLQAGGAERLRLADLDLTLDAAQRQRVLPIFAAAVIYGDGQGRDELGAFVSQALPESGRPASDWLQALREARLYARAHPQIAMRVLNEFLRFPKQECRDLPALVNAATEAAQALTDISLRDGLPMLLSVVAHARDQDAQSGPNELSDLLERAPSYGGPRLTDRTLEALSATRAWLADEPESIVRQRIALRVALMLVAVAYELVAHAPSDAMALQLGAVPAPDTPEHRAAVRAAARYAAELVASVESDALSELEQTYPPLMRRAAGLAPMVGVSDIRRAAIRPAVSIVRSAVLDSWERVPVLARLRIAEADRNRRIADRAVSDPEVNRLSVMFGIMLAGKRRVREWERLMRRAREMGGELGPDGALDLLVEALGHLAGRFHTPGAGNLLLGAGEAASRKDAEAGLRRMRSDVQLRPYLGHFLVGALHGPGVATKALRALAADGDTAAEVVGALDLIASAEEQRLTEVLFAQPTAHAALASHLRECRRPEAERAEALVELAERTDTEAAAQILELFGTGTWSIAVPAGLRERFLAQMKRIAQELAFNRSDGANVSDALALIVSWGDDRWLRIFEVRREAMLTDGLAKQYRLWDLVPDDFLPAFAELSEHQRDSALPRLAAWLEAAGSDPLWWRLEHGLIALLSRVGGERPKLAEIAGRWYAEGGKARARTLELVGALLSRGVVTAVLDVIVESTTTPEDESVLIGSLSRPPMSWVGDLEEEYTKRAEIFAKRSRRGSQHARSFARAAEAHLRRLAEREAEQTRQRREGYGR
jgi:hypothetical protein